MVEKPKLLIVDDEPEIGNLLELFLEERFEIATYTDPREACAAVDKKYYDLVVSDIKMPHLSGLDVVKHVKNSSPKTEVVLITGHAQTDKDTTRARQMGASGIIYKPFGDPEKILNYLDDIISGKTIANGRKYVVESNIQPKTGAVASEDLNRGNGKPTIMVLDDEEDLVEIVTMFLSEDYNVISFFDPQEAIAHCLDHDFKCILTDLTMPQMPGEEFIKIIRKTLSHVPILVMSGYSHRDPSMIEAMSAGAIDLIPKPFPNPDFVRNLIKRYIQ